jgi:hypothetical protein
MEEFVADFNRIYQHVGISLQTVEAAPTKKTPDNSGVAGDSDLIDRADGSTLDS